MGGEQFVDLSIFVEGKRASTSVRYSCGLRPRRRQLIRME